MSQPSRTRSNRTRRLARKLAAYAAGGASLSAAEANAAIVYRDFSPNGIFVSQGTFALDIDQNGTTDFQLVHNSQFLDLDSSHIYHSFLAYIQGMANANGVVFNSSTNAKYGAELPAGFAVRADAFHSQRITMWRTWFNRSPETSTAYQYGGSFRSGYLGLVFRIPATGDHTAWLALGVPSRGPVTLWRLAYETEPGKPILAGDTGISPHLPGDTDDDDRVDIVDLNNVRNNFGATGDGVLGDANGDDVVDIQDLNAVRNNFGAGNPVPEPPSLVLLAAGAAGLAALRRKRMTRRPR